jgi:regulator of RNase E activity RraB
MGMSLTFKKISTEDYNLFLEAEEALEEAREENEDLFNEDFDLDKTWNILHFLFTNKITMANGIAVPAFNGSSLIGDAINLDSDEIDGLVSSKQIHDFLLFAGNLESNQIGNAIDINELLENEIYPVSKDDNREEIIDFVQSNFDSFIIFLKSLNETDCLLYTIC